TPSASIASSSVSAFAVLLRKNVSGVFIDSPASMNAAKCITAVACDAISTRSTSGRSLTSPTTSSAPGGTALRCPPIKLTSTVHATRYSPPVLSPLNPGSPPPALDRGPPDEQDAPRQRCTVLVVDDNRGDLRLAQEAIRGDEFEVAVASSGAEALLAIERHQP